MTAARASIIIATRNRAELLPYAIESALGQTVPVEVIVVDDGSTDRTQGIVDSFAGQIRSYWQPPLGVAAARNAGMRAAAADFVQFLDDDDVIYPGKVETQLAALRLFPIADWCVCDTLIREVDGKTERASERYRYAAMGLPGRSEIAPLLMYRNFIPVHAPLIRRDALAGLAFPEGKLEDWSFWLELSKLAPVRFIDDVLCEYRKQRGGRNSCSG